MVSRQMVSVRAEGARSNRDPRSSRQPPPRKVGASDPGPAILPPTTSLGKTVHSHTPNAKIVVNTPPGPDGRPGYTICMPSVLGNIAAMVGPATFVQVICLSPTQSETTPDQSVQEAIRNWRLLASS